MKIIKRILLALMPISLVIGCSDAFMDRPDLDNITADSYWKTPSDLNLFVIQFYTSFPGWQNGSWNAGIYWNDDNSDNIITSSINTRLAGRNTINSGTGNWDYGKIRSVNTFLEKYHKVEADFSEISQYVGEGYFFRAYYYFNLVQSYGDVQWTSKTLTPDSEELYKTRSPRNVIIDSVLTDLDKAIEYMNSGENSNGNRLNKEIALLFKSRVALYEGTWEKYHQGTTFGVEGSDGTKYIKIAETTAKQLIDNPSGYGIQHTGKINEKYNFVEDYRLLFNQTNYAGNKEVMLWREFSTDLNITHNGQLYLARVGAGDHGISKELIDQYLCTDGKPIALSPKYKGDHGLTQTATNRDPRLASTIYLPEYPMIIETVLDTFKNSQLGASGETGCPTGYTIFKGSNHDLKHATTHGSGISSSPIFRFAEALLNYAEARAELGTITQADIDITINVLRDRVNMPHLNIASIESDPNWEFPNLSPIINEVRRERQVELAAEGYRFDDLMRWQAADELIVDKRMRGVYFMQSDFPDIVIGTDIIVDENGYVDPHRGQIPTGNKFNVKRDYLLPVPLNEITLNSKLTQNPGWSK
ncbi:MAG: RagB/SusD family nutrient uptake outer membrane protein [Bacteroidales bacterium]